MHTVELIPHLPNLTGDEIDGWISAALAEASALRQHDARLFPLMDDATAMETAHALRDAWQAWAADAGALLRQVGLSGGKNIATRLDQLKFAIGYARCLNQMPPEEMLARHKRMDGGQATVYTIEEARRELGPGTLMPRMTAYDDSTNKTRTSGRLGGNWPRVSGLAPGLDVGQRRDGRRPS